MRLIIDFDTEANACNVGAAHGVTDRATALDLLEKARQVIHLQGDREREQSGIQFARADLLRNLDKAGGGNGGK